MDEAQADAYYRDMRARGGGAAQAKQGLGFGPSSGKGCVSNFKDEKICARCFNVATAYYWNESAICM